MKQLDKQQRQLAQQALQTQVASSSMVTTTTIVASAAAAAAAAAQQHSPLNRSPRKPDYLESPRKVEHEVRPHREFLESPKRQGYPMPLPQQSPSQLQSPSSSPSPSKHAQTPAHFRSSSDELLDTFQQCSIADALELGLPVDDIDEKRMQEKRDAVSCFFFSFFFTFLFIAKIDVYLFYMVFVFVFVLFAVYWFLFVLRLSTVVALVMSIFCIHD